MGVLGRMGTLIRAKMSQILDRAEDPRLTMDYSYEKQVEMLQSVKRGIVDVVTSKRRIQLQAAKLQDNVAKLDVQARRAGAIDELVAAGTLEDVTGGGDMIDRELGRVTISENVNKELEALKRQLQ